MGLPSPKSRESTVSMDSPGSSSGGSINGDAPDTDVVKTVRIPHGHVDESEKQYKNNKKLKRGAGKMLSLFGSLRRKGSESSVTGESDVIKKVQ